MSSITWTPGELSSSAAALCETCWRAVEAQHRNSTMKLVDSLDEQRILESLIEATKPDIPDDCRHLDYLLFTPFRYHGPYPIGSRFRRAGFSEGVFYASLAPLTAITEMAFYKLLFFAESPDTPIPANSFEFTVFAVPVETALCIDLTKAPLNRDVLLWRRLSDYAACQALSDLARSTGIEAIAYQSVRDPAGGKNFAILRCCAFAATRPSVTQSWRIQLAQDRAWARCESPIFGAEMDMDYFAKDSRLAPLRRS